MADQGDLFGDIRSRYDDGTYPKDFWQWLPDNWHVYDGVVKLARKAKSKGVARWSVRAVIHVLRWQTALREGGQNNVKINNNCTPGLSRLIMAREPDLKEFFEKRHPPARDQARRLLDGKLYSEPEDDE